MMNFEHEKVAKPDGIIGFFDEISYEGLLLLGE